MVLRSSRGRPLNAPAAFIRWLLAAAMFALPSYTLAQVRGGVQSGVRSGDQRNNETRPTTRPVAPVPSYSPCWRSTVVRDQTIIWNCQPYPPPRP
jgi:hypothetical protein